MYGTALLNPNIIRQGRRTMYGIALLTSNAAPSLSSGDAQPAAAAAARLAPGARYGAAGQAAYTGRVLLCSTGTTMRWLHSTGAVTTLQGPVHAVTLPAPKGGDVAAGYFGGNHMHERMLQAERTGCVPHAATRHLSSAQGTWVPRSSRVG